MSEGIGTKLIEHRDIASGKFTRTLPVADIDILLLDPSPLRRPVRAIAIPDGGALTITGVDGVNDTLPDMGSSWQWDVQAKNIVATGSTALIVTLIW